MAEQIREHDQKVISSATIDHAEEWVTYPDGRKILLDTVKAPIYGSDGQPIGLVGISRDITERTRGEKERRQLEQQFHHAQKLESLGVLAGGIAHDFNNILTIILGHCYLAKDNLVPAKNYLASFEKIETAANRATQLCKQMLTYAGKSPLVQTRVNLTQLVDGVIKMLQSAINKNVVIELEHQARIPGMIGDAGQIQQIVMNLIINAAEAIGEVNGTIRVVLSHAVVAPDHADTDTFGTVALPGNYACLEVTDSGCGMDEETKKRIFEPFYTTKFTGRGLGMSAIQGIIKAHKGIMHLTSTPGIGTTFKVCFPVPEDAGNEAAALPAAPAAPLPVTVGGTVLLCEDEEMLRLMGEALLKVLGFSCMTAVNGREALEIYRTHGSEIDVILLDLIMPVMGGIEAYHELRTINPAVPIIICSGYDMDSVTEIIKNDVHAGFLHKPYKPEQLQALMGRMMAP
jgi:signal transduction histidine kinase/CheY-like chemotaxis protein